MDGYMCGTAPPTNYEVGSTSGPNAVWRDVQNGSYHNTVGPLGPGDYAGALEWDIGSLGPGQTRFFAVGKNTLPAVSSPEPDSFVLFAAGSGALLIGLVLRRRARRSGTVHAGRWLWLSSASPSSNLPTIPARVVTPSFSMMERR